MTTKGTLKSLARLGYVRSIADQYEEQAPHVSEALRRMLSGLRSLCDAAMMCWPERLNQTDLRRIGDMLAALGQATPLNNSHDITAFTAFGLALLEDLTPMLKPSRAAAVDRVKVALLELHGQFAASGEAYEDLKAGADGADTWAQAESAIRTPSRRQT